jgi:hypothetical protein
MVKVYFETGIHAELVAIFDSEETYDACFDALEKLRKKHGFDFISESVEDEKQINNLNYAKLVQ